MSSILVIIRVIILLHPRPLVAWMTLQKFTDLRYETLFHQPYSTDLSPTDYHIFKRLDTFFYAKNTFHFKEETTFKDFLVGKPLEFYRTGIKKNLINRRQKCIEIQGSDFDCLKPYLNSLIFE